MVGGSRGSKEFLQKLSVIIDDRVTYGGLLVFGNEDSLICEIPNYKIEYLEIAGISYEDAPTRYSVRLTSENNLFTAFFDIYERLSKKIDVPFSLKAGFRDDDPPHLQAIREALVNLVMHTDYFSPANPRIRVFSNRFEFFNPGALPKDIEFILKEDFSLPRNPIIAKIFRFVKLAENIGSGFHKMINGWDSHYRLKPLIDGDFDFYKITFPTTTTQKTTQKKIYDREKEILELIENNPYLNMEEIARVIGLSRVGVKYHIDKLKVKGIIKREGSKKKGKWVMQKGLK